MSRSYPPVSVFGVPTDIGASRRGVSMGPEALRVAGLVEAIADRGAKAWQVQLTAAMGRAAGVVTILVGIYCYTNFIALTAERRDHPDRRGDRHPARRGRRAPPDHRADEASDPRVDLSS